MKFVTVALATLAAAVAFAEEPQQEEGVYVLTDANFHDYIHSHEFVLVDFYKPWCGPCKDLKPEFAKAAQQLEEQGSEITLAKVDCTEETCSGVSIYPTLKLYTNGTPKNYYSWRPYARIIVPWLYKETGTGSDEERDSAKENLKFDDGIAVYTGDITEGEQTAQMEDSYSHFP